MGNGVSFNDAGFVFNIILNGNLEVGNNANLDGNWDLTGNVEIGNNGTFNGDFEANGNIEIGNNNTVNGNVTSGGNLDIGNNSVVNGICIPNHVRCTGVQGMTNPTVTSQTTTDTTPVVTGSYTSSVATSLTVTVNSVIYTLGSSSELTNSSDNWTLDLSLITPLSLGTYEVVATSGDGSSFLSDTTSNELVIEAVPACATFRDEFSSQNYGNNDGTANWLSDWDEGNDGSNPGGGDVRITGNRLRIQDDDRSVSRGADISAYSSATLTFDYEESSLDSASEYADLEIRTGGSGSWTFLQRFAGDPNDSGSVSIDIGGYISSNTEIQFITPNGGQHNNDDFYVDDVQIEACNIMSNPSTDHFAISHDGSAINCQAEEITISAHTSADAVDTSYTGTVSFSTSSSHGNWSYVSGGTSSNLTDSGNGMATYAFDGSESGEVVLGLLNTFAETINIDVSDGTYSESASEDDDLEYAAAGFQFSTIGTQIAGKSSNTGYGAQTLELEAINTNTMTGACEAALSGSVSVELAFECQNPSSCIRPVYLGSTSASDSIPGTDSGDTLSYTSVLLDFDSADGKAEFVLNYPDAGEIELHALYTLSPSGETLSGSSNLFVSRPFGFNVDVVGNPDPPAVDHDDTVFTTAGTPFQINIAAALWDGTDAGADGIPDNHDNDDPSDNDSLENNTVTLGVTNYTGLPNFGQEGEAVTLSAILIEPFVSAYPDSDFPQVTLSSFSGGSASTSSASFNDVGVIEIRAAITDGDYLDISASETSRIISKSGYVGRFIPASFQITPENGMFANTCNGIVTPHTYIGQPFGYDVIRPGFLVSAMNALPTPTVTQNYTGLLWAKLSDASVALTSPTADSTQTGSDAATLMSISYTQDTNLYTITDNGNGTLSFEFGDDQFVYNKDANSEISEFDSDIDLTVTAVTDLDSVSTTAAFTLTPDPVHLRFGRIRMSNVHGSELIDLQMPMVVEYFNGGFYTTHFDDGCTIFDDNDVIVVADNLSTPGSSTISVTNQPAANLGDFGITLTSPGAGITGQIDLRGRLNGGVNDNEWLRYSWDSVGVFDDDPFASTTFGIFSGNDVNIYIQQIFTQP